MKKIHATKDYQDVFTQVGFDIKKDNPYGKIYLYKFNEPKYPIALEAEISKKFFERLA